MDKEKIWKDTNQSEAWLSIQRSRNQSDIYEGLWCYLNFIFNDNAFRKYLHN